jgi:antitoxin Phd
MVICFGLRNHLRGLEATTRLVTQLVYYVVCAMQTWPVQDAKARFSEFLDACIKEGPQIVTKQGTEAAVLVPIDEWRRMQTSVRPSLKQLLLSDVGRTDLALLERGQARCRDVQSLE